MVSFCIDIFFLFLGMIHTFADTPLVLSAYLFEFTVLVSKEGIYFCGNGEKMAKQSLLLMIGIYFAIINNSALSN